MKEDKIYVGTKNELIEHFYQLTQSTQNTFQDKNNLLICKEGLTKQIDEIITKQSGIGQVYYMTVDGDSSEINLTLINSYIHVKENCV